MSIADNPVQYVEIARSRNRGLPIVWEHSPGRFEDQDPCSQVICNHSGQRLCPIFRSEKVSQGRSTLFGLRKEFHVVRVDPKTRNFRILQITDDQIYLEYFSDTVDIFEGITKYFGNLDKVEYVAKEDLRLNGAPIENVVPENFKEAVLAAETKIVEKGSVFFLTREDFEKILDEKKKKIEKESTKRPWNPDRRTPVAPSTPVEKAPETPTAIVEE